ncbi:PaaI family thioesterase [Novosphingobium aerophilum]|uniref:PaaI family thioesterase n=1 Tax=Novosphingobium aerophilum TaxID=2839843 RepID=A0A7X1KB51_9SPHN|nr:PaaI family thioesterase [Novosphingobium aerophilum]MBC2650854.1 PaaI family thioesterase [Novosphingobium aerophilum]
MTGSSTGRFTLAPSPVHKGWHDFHAPGEAAYNRAVLGPTRLRGEGPATVRVRIEPGPQLANSSGVVHGGALLGLIDLSLFGALMLLTGRDPTDAITLDLTNQFIAPGAMDRPIDAVVERLRETGRLVFLRGVVEQEDTLVCAFQATVRKLGPSA